MSTDLGASGPAEPAEPAAEGLLGPDDIAYHLELTAPQMKIVHTALHSLFDDLGREQRDVKAIVSEVLAKLPGEHAIRAIDISRRRPG
ncbi:MAG TPA: hypothetical protein VFN55_19180 [Solirubrobacteraceae bacterium]|nr:hypothetical protein [Solirubrobacteraceae bacterium]